MRRRTDGHHHLWDLRRHPYPWLAPGAPARPFGDQEPLRRDYLLADYLRDAAGLGILASVFVEASAGVPDAAELEWIEAIATPAFPAVSIGHADLRRPDIAAVLDSFQAQPRMRGIRMALCWSERPEWRFADGPDIILDADFRAGVRALAQRDLIFEVLAVPGQLRQVADLAAENPDLQIVINHLGTPLQGESERADWIAGIRDCARQPNVAIKLSGLWVIDRGWTPERIREPVRQVVDHFGIDRCFWGSNYPVEGLMCRMPDQIANLEAVLDDLDDSEMDAIFRRTAARLYRIPSDPATSIPPAS